MPYGTRWRTRRRAFHQLFNQGAVHRYCPLQAQKVHEHLSSFLESPENARKAVRKYGVSTLCVFAFLTRRLHFIRLTTSIIFSVVYGLKITSLNDENVALAEETVRIGSELGVPGAYWIEFLPILKYNPSWVPGNTAKKAAAIYRPVVETLRRKPYGLVKDAVVSHELVSSDLV